MRQPAAPCPVAAVGVGNMGGAMVARLLDLNDGALLRWLQDSP